jgi:hypothetical protein
MTKKFTLILLSFLGLFSTVHIWAINPPQIYTSNYNINTALAAGTYVNDNFDDMTNTSASNLSYTRPVPADANGYAYVIESRSSNALNDLLGGLATSASEAIYIRNTGTGNINMVGGYFGEVSTGGNKVTPSTNNIKITVDDYVYEYKSTLESTIICFVFPSAFTEVKIESLNGNCPALSRLYWGSSLSTDIKEVTKSFAIYPNPTTDGVTISVAGTVSIYSTMGQLLLTEEVLEGEYLSLSALTPGSYVLKLVNNNGVFEQLIIKK